MMCSNTSGCLTSSSAHTRSDLSACTAADITPSTLSSNEKRSRKSRPASSRVDITLPFRTDLYSPARAYGGGEDAARVSASTVDNVHDTARVCVC